MKIFVFSTGLILLAIIAILIAIYTKNITAYGNENNMDNQVSKFIGLSGTSLDSLNYLETLKKKNGYTFSYKGWN